MNQKTEIAMQDDYIDQEYEHDDDDPLGLDEGEDADAEDVDDFDYYDDPDNL